MKRCEITVLKIGFDAELAKVYKAGRPDFSPCACFKEGEVYRSGGQWGLDKPENFPCCDAWDAVGRYAQIYACGGKLFNKDSAVVCCPDGLRPVVFLLKTIEED